MAHLQNVNKDVSVSNYFELQTLEDVKGWDFAFQTCGKRPEYDMLFMTGNDILKVEVKAQLKTPIGYFFEYRQIPDSRIPNNLNKIQLQSFVDKAPPNKFENSGISLSKADMYFLYTYNNKDELYNYIEGQADIIEGKYFQYDLYKIPMNFLKGLINNNTNNKIIKKTSFNGQGFLIPESELNQYRAVQYGELADYDELLKLECKKNFRLPTAISGVNNKSGSIPTIAFSKNCNGLPQEATLPANYPNYLLNQCGSGKNVSSSESSSSSSSEGEETSLKVYNRLKRIIDKKYKTKKEKYL